MPKLFVESQDSRVLSIPKFYPSKSQPIYVLCTKKHVKLKYDDLDSCLKILKNPRKCKFCPKQESKN